MSKAVITIIFILIVQINLQGQWFQQNPGTINTLKEVYFNNDNTGWVCGFGKILKTTNGGLNWIHYQLENKNFNSIYFTGNNTGWICGDSGKVYITTDAGSSWNIVNAGTANNLMRVRFTDQNSGIIVGFNRTIIKTTNGGSSWFSTISNDSMVNFYGCTLLSSSLYFVTGTNSYIFKTTNAGASWDTLSFNMVNPLWTTDFINNSTGWITGCCGMFVKTTNNGMSWENLGFLSSGFTLYTLKFVDAYTGFISGDGGRLYRTINSGNSWDSTITGTDQILYSVYMINNNTGWSVGNFGTILKTTNGGGTGFPIGINQISSAVPKEFILYQNYPNPFNPETKIQFEIPFFGEADEWSVTLSIYDILGKEVTKLVNEELQPGKYEVTWNASIYPSGIYYCVLSSGNYSSAKKLVLVR